MLTDSDDAGMVIRNYINSILPKDKIIHLYIPELPGRERRKVGSKSGLLGVEGVDAELLRKLFLPYSEGSVSAESAPRGDVTKLDFYLDGLSGNEQRRAQAQLARHAASDKSVLDGIACRAEYALYTR